MAKRVKAWFTYKNILLAVLALIFFFFLRWNSFTTPFERDEGEYAYSAWILRQGTMPYQNSFLQKPPMIVYSYTFSQIVFGDNLWGPRLLASVFILLTSVFVYVITQQKIGQDTGWVAVFIFLAIVSSPINASLAANTEVFMILPLTMFYYLYNKKITARKSLYWLFAGVCSSLALWYKPICLWVLGFIYILWLVRIYKEEKKEIFRFVGFSVFGFTASSLIIFLPFLGIIKYLWEEVVVFNGLYAKHWGASPRYLWINLSRMRISFWIVYLLVFVYFFLRPKGWKEFLGILIFSILAVFQTAIRHYYILLVPFLSVICTITLFTLSRKYFSGTKIVLMLVVFLYAFIFPVRNGIFLTPQDLNIWVYGAENPFGESMEMAKKIQEVTKEDDSIYIAGSEPQIYYYSKRKASNRFVITYPFIIKTGLRPTYQKEAIEALEGNLPQAIVYSNLSESGFWNDTSPTLLRDYMDGLLKEKYRAVGGFVWEKGRGVWKDALLKSEADAIDLILYVKK